MTRPLAGAEQPQWPSRPREMLTVDIQVVPVQDVGAQPGDTVGQAAQLPVELFPVQHKAPRLRMVGADDVHSSGRPPFLRPGEVRTWGGTLGWTSFSQPTWMWRPANPPSGSRHELPLRAGASLSHKGPEWTFSLFKP